MNKPTSIQPAQLFAQFPQIVAGITWREGTEPAYQDANYSSRPLKDALDPAKFAAVQAAVTTKRAHLAQELVSPAATTHFMHQIHGDQVILADETDSAGDTQADAIISAAPNQLLAAAIADCAGVLLYDPVAQVLATAHSGWRGTKANIITKAIERMTTLGTQPANLFVYVSPVACPEHYEVGEEFTSFFDAAFLPRINGKLGFDNQAAIFQQLITAGVQPDHIQLDTRCTVTDTHLHSFRRDGNLSGRFVAYIGRRA